MLSPDPNSYYSILLRARTDRIYSLETEVSFYKRTTAELLVAKTEEEKEAIRWAIATFIETQDKRDKQG